MMRTLVLVLLIAVFVSGTVNAEKNLSIRDKTLSKRTSMGGDDPAAAAEENLVTYSVPTSLEGPIDPDTYVLGPSDELYLIIRGAETTFHQILVFPEGNVILPNVGSHKAAGMTLTQFRDDVRGALKSYYRNIDIDVQLTKPRSFVVYVSGQVARPGAVELTAPFRVSQAILAAGGVGEAGTMREIEIRREDEVLQKVDLFLFHQLGRGEHNPVLAEGLTVHVPIRKMRASSVGEVRKSGIFEVVPGETAADIIEFSGGFATTADTSQLLLERKSPDRGLTTIVFHADSAQYVGLQDLDLLVIPDLASQIGYEPVEVIGGGGRDGEFQIQESETLRDFLLRLWRFTYRYNIEDAIIERWAEDDHPEYIAFNVRAVLEGDTLGATVLKPGDTINFPVREKQVFVTGEVVLPGAFPFQPGYSAERYIALAGGPNVDGSYGKIEIFGVDGANRKGDRHSMIYRGETIIVKTKTSKQLAAIFWGMTSLTSLVLAIYAVNK